MSTWLIIFLSIVGVLVIVAAWALFAKRKEEREREARYDQRRREFEERDREDAERTRQAEERHRRDLEAATLYGAEGESIEEAAERLGVECRFRTGAEWLGRRGNDAFRAPLTGQPRPVFFKIDPSAPVEIPRGAYSKEGGSWKELSRETRDKDYHKQLYDGDDFEWWTIFADEIGRRIEIKDGASQGKWCRPWNDAGEYVPSWEW